MPTPRWIKAPSGNVSTGLALLFASVMAAAPTHAALPLITEDARLLDAGECQLETMVRRNRDSTEYWALPSCNVTGNLELLAGGVRTHDATGNYASDIQVQGKTLLKPLGADGWGVGLVPGTIWRPRSSARDWYLVVPVTLTFQDDRVAVNANVGWLRDGEAGQHRAIWALGTDVRLSDHVTLIAEVFGQNRGRVSHQVGVRYALIADRVEINASYGGQAGDHIDGRWFTIAVRFAFPALLPGAR